jgi:hypothetical protein
MIIYPPSWRICPKPTCGSVMCRKNAHIGTLLARLSLESRGKKPVGEKPPFVFCDHCALTSRLISHFCGQLVLILVAVETVEAVPVTGLYPLQDLQAGSFEPPYSPPPPPPRLFISKIPARLRRGVCRESLRYLSAYG